MIERYKYYKAVINNRVGPGWHVKPECEGMDGAPVIVSTGWLIDDISMYEGEWAMLIEGDGRKDFPISWIASGDLKDVEEIAPPWRKV